jgi:carbon starvation protein
MRKSSVGERYLGAVMDLFLAEVNGQSVLRAMPLLLGVLCVLAIAYRYYSAFLAAKVAMLDDRRQTPAHKFNDGQNYHPTNKWVLFGHHFAAISGAGPLIGPVLAIQYGYMPGLLWLVIGVCLAGAVQDMLVLAASVRRGGKSLAHIALTELGKPASIIVSLAILFIVVIALAGLGFVVVKALGGEEVKLPKGMEILLPKNQTIQFRNPSERGYRITIFPAGCQVRARGGKDFVEHRGPFLVKEEIRPESSVNPISRHDERGEIISLGIPCNEILLGGEEVPLLADMEILVPIGVRRITEWLPGGPITFPEGCKVRYTEKGPFSLRPEKFTVKPVKDHGIELREMPEGDVCILGWEYVQIIPGSSWGTFTIACTIPIALFVAFWMYRFRKGHVVEASAIGAAGVLFATVAGGWIQGSALEPIFSLSKESTIYALCGYGFIASVLPVWMLLCPRDYISSFLKIGTIALLVIGTLAANPPLPCPTVNPVFATGGPTFPGHIFPFVFICIMCGSISGFHALVSSGTTPKMIDKESHVRTIGYGSMLIEGLVGVVALIAAASLPVDLYYDINVDLDKVQAFQPKLDELYKEQGIDRNAEKAQIGVQDLAHLKVQDANLAQMEQLVGGESLRGRTGGAVTLAVGMSRILTQAADLVNLSFAGLVKYWYHFAIMFEALFILTTIDTGTRIGRFLFQETLGQAIPQFARTDWLPGSILGTGVITLGWGVLVATGSIGTIWPMFGIANQLLAVLALCLVTTLLINTGRAKYAWVTLAPMAFVVSTTMTAGVIMVRNFMSQGGLVGILNLSLTVFVMSSVAFILLWALARWIAVLNGVMPVKSELPEPPKDAITAMASTAIQERKP